MNVKFKLDTGAEANVLPNKIFRKLQEVNEKRLNETQTILAAFGSNTMLCAQAVIKPILSTFICHSWIPQLHFS